MLFIFKTINTSDEGQEISLQNCAFIFISNRIEDEWHQLNTHEITGRMFEHEDDLAIAMIVFMICGSVMAVFQIMQ